MRIECNGIDLHDAVSKVIKAVSSHAENKVLEGIKLTAEGSSLILTATDGEIAIEKRIRANVRSEGETVAAGRLFHSFTAKMGEDRVSLTLKDRGILSIEFRDVSGDVSCMNADEFPPFKTLSGVEGIEIEQGVLKDLISKAVISVSTVREDRAVLKGVNLEVSGEVLTAVALDGFRLSYATAPLKGVGAAFNIIVPGKALGEIGKLLENSERSARIYMQKNIMMAEFEDIKFTARLLDGTFINYKQIIPVSFATEVIVDKKQLESCLEVANILGSSSNLPNRIDMDIRDKMIFSTTTNELGEVKDKVVAHIIGKDINISFNIRFMLEALKATNADMIKLKFNNPNNPCIITPVENENIYLFLILPLYGRK